MTFTNALLVSIVILLVLIDVRIIEIKDRLENK